MLLRAQADRRPAGRPRRLAHRPDRRATSRSRAKADYADDVDASAAQEARQAAATPRVAGQLDAHAHAASTIFAKAGSPVIAVNDGKIVKIGRTDAPRAASSSCRTSTATRYTYAHLAQALDAYPVPKPSKPVAERQVSKELSSRADAGPQADRPGQRRRRRSGRAPPAPRRRRRPPRRDRRRRSAAASERPQGAPVRQPGPPAAPTPPAARSSCSTPAASARGYTTFKAYFTDVYDLEARDVVLKPLKAGRKVIAGTILGRIGAHRARRSAPHLLFEIRPAGTRRAAHRPQADPRRLEAARVDRRSTAPPARTRSSAPTPRTRRSARSC